MTARDYADTRDEYFDKEDADEAATLKRDEEQRERVTRSCPVDDGGPAYPIAEGRPCWRGKSIRDSFAEAALRSLIPFTDTDEVIITKAEVAREAYAYADAMLAERERTHRCEYCQRVDCDDVECKRFAETEDHPDADDDVAKGGAS